MERLVYRLVAIVGLALLTGCGGSWIGQPSQGFFEPTAEEADARQLALSTVSGGLADMGPYTMGTANALWPLGWLGGEEETRSVFEPLIDARVRNVSTTTTVARLIRRQVDDLPEIPLGTYPVDHTDEATGLHWTGALTITGQGAQAELVGRDGEHELHASLAASMTDETLNFTMGVNGNYVVEDNEVTVRMVTELRGGASVQTGLAGQLTGRHNAAVEVHRPDGRLLFRSSESMALGGWLNEERLGLDFIGGTSVGLQFETGLWWVRTQATLNFAADLGELPVRQIDLEPPSDMLLSGHMRCLASNGLVCEMTVDETGAVVGTLHDAAGAEVAVIEGHALLGFLVTFADPELEPAEVFWGLL